MISQNLLAWQRSRKFRLENDTVYGVKDGVGFSVVEEDGGKLAVFMLAATDDAVFDEFEAAITAQGDGLGDMQVGDVEGYLALFFDESTGEMDDYLLDEMLAYVAQNARACGFRAPNVCVMCGAPANKRSFYNNMVQPMCADCSAANKQNSASRAAAPAPVSAQRTEEDEFAQGQQRRRTGSEEPYGRAPLSTGRHEYSEEEDDTYSGYGRGARDNYDAPRRRPAREYNEDPVAAASAGSMGMGILGALLGALAGMVPFVISILCSYPLSALCTFCGVGAVLGYVIFKGQKEKKNGVISTILFSELVCILSVFFSQLIPHLRNGMTASAAFSAVGSSSLELIVHMVIGVLGTLLGVALAIESLNKYVESK